MTPQETDYFYPEMALIEVTEEKLFLIQELARDIWIALQERRNKKMEEKWLKKLELASKSEASNSGDNSI